jgi:glycosyltransferase involved in cell wall biosynthesis
MSTLVALITTKHTRDDSRIFHKFAKSYRSMGRVELLVFDGKGDGSRDDVTIIDGGSHLGGVARLFYVLRFLRERKPSLAHFNDPELLLLLPLCYFFGLKAAYDAHEDLPEQVYSKAYIPSKLHPLVSLLSKFLLYFLTAFSCFNIAATKRIASRWYLFGQSKVVRNYPNLTKESLKRECLPTGVRLLYFGGISVERGLNEIIAIAQRFPELRIDMYGKVVDDSSLIDLPVNLRFLGFVGHHTLAEKVSENKYVGLCLLKDIERFRYSLPIKLFEYQALGCPVICTDFFEWKKIGFEESCIFVNPLDYENLFKLVDDNVDDERWRILSSVAERSVVKFDWEKEFSCYQSFLLEEILGG